MHPFMLPDMITGKIAVFVSRLFEFEAMSSDSTGKKYVSTNGGYDGNKQCDAVFEIGLS